jgi:hypothetical protein
MKKFNSQAETHSNRRGPPLASSRTTHAETHSRAPGTPLASSSYFFLFLNRLQAQAHRDPVGQPLSSRALCRNLFFFIYF